MELVEDAEPLPQHTGVDGRHDPDAIQGHEADGLHRQTDEHDGVHNPCHQGVGGEEVEGPIALERELDTVHVAGPMAARAFALEAVGQYRVVVHYPGDPRGPSVNGDLADRVDIALDAGSPIVVAQAQPDLRPRDPDMRRPRLIGQVALREVGPRVQSQVAAREPLRHGSMDVTILGLVFRLAPHKARRPVLLDDPSHHLLLDPDLTAQLPCQVERRGGAARLHAVAHERVLHLVRVPEHKRPRLLVLHQELVVHGASAPHCASVLLGGLLFVGPAACTALRPQVSASSATVAADSSVGHQCREEHGVGGLQIVLPNHQRLAMQRLVPDSTAVVVVVRRHV
mmetsp:Transcript_12791/g.36739  ORF Transcript_12791/g.36739 Transcript_12791/m.36739 type:complete len:341 (+) Transcript_12791:669-1691(+)